MKIENGKLHLDWRTDGTPSEGSYYHWVSRSKVCGPTKYAGQAFKAGVLWAPAIEIELPAQARTRTALSQLERNLILSHAQTYVKVGADVSTMQVLRSITTDCNILLSESLESVLCREIDKMRQGLPETTEDA